MFVVVHGMAGFVESGTGTISQPDQMGSKMIN
jgi:hypothetical protein